MKRINKSIKELKSVIPFINQKYRPYAEEVISLFTDRKIEKRIEAEKLLDQLSSRGKGPQSAIKKITDKYREAESAIGKLTRPTTQLFFVSGVTHSTKTYKQKFTKAGVIGERSYKIDTPFAVQVKAKNRKEAEYNADEAARLQLLASMPLGGGDSNTATTTTVNGSTISSITSASSFSPASTGSQMMKAVSPVDYYFIPANVSLLKNEGFCVLDQFLGIYGPLIKHMNKDYFIDSCYKVRGEQHPAKKIVSRLDVGIDDECDEEGYREAYWAIHGESPDGDDCEAWNIKHGVSPDMLKKICEREDISHYCFDITRKCFSKYISRNRNYPALIYYCVNNHMYWIDNRDEANSLVQQAKDSETKIKSHCIQEDEHTKTNIYTEKDRGIHEDIAVADLVKYDNVTIIYSKTNLNEELDLIIEQYNYIPAIINHRYTVTQIKFKKDERDIILVVDPNIEHGMTYKDVRQLCNNTQIEFKNQTFSNLIKELKRRFLEIKQQRHQPTKEERQQLLDKADGCCELCKKVIKKAFDIDHIVPLAEGGTNESVNLQVLCKPCHFEKTQTEHERGYIKLSQTESSFNTTVTDIFNSELNTKHAFIETIKEKIPTKLSKNKIHFFDLVRCRRTAMYFNQFEYPLFTVMDEPEYYKGIKKAGIYFVETMNYLPMRGNGWYSLPMIMYCLENNIISENNIQHVIYSSLTIPKDYYTKFIDYLDSVMGDKSKLAVNSMIGCFKPKMRENWRSLLITTNSNIAYTHFLEKNGCFIDTRQIGDNTYYQVYDRFYTNKEETEAPIYNQIVEQEAIEVHKLKIILGSKGGVVLDVNTDCLSCVFPTDESPFELVNDTYIDGYFDDKEQKKFKYRKEDKEGRLKVERMKAHIRTDRFYPVRKEFNILPDDDDFKMLVDTILKSKKSFHIDGRAGCGKTTLIKMIQKELDSKEIQYKTLAPTNKACRLIDGETMHRFSARATGKYIRETLKFYKYIFIDEVSMMSEMFYKFFIVLKRMLPHIKFIIAGDFAQLLPVKDRVEDCNYKNSLALHELCDGNRLELTKCRRSDATLFNMLLPNNINNIKKTDFKNKMTNRHICFTNKKRMTINKMEMDRMIKLKKVKAFELEGLNYDPNSQNVRLCAGMPIIARRNNKELNIFNNETFTIKAIKKTDNVIVIIDDGKEQQVPIPEFTKMFNIAFCITTHKSQGATFDEPYTIHEFEQFDERLKYVALSRATDINLINII